ncbi:hypothetical protein BZA70DRAFT_272005 [Myxozyma melibiosi]|uniref:BTB domain-containing protein n=1 Tax=Myxozyma melibiosi TaxID=54550 RepID=A0ABR1FCX2_9ASCO
MDSIQQSETPSSTAGSDVRPEERGPLGSSSDYEAVFSGLRQSPSAAADSGEKSGSEELLHSDNIRRQSAGRTPGFNRPTAVTESTIRDSTSASMTTAAGTSVPSVSVNSSNRFNGPALNMNIPRILPHEQVFSIQVGDTLFRLSGASLSSDGPSYFTSFFSFHRQEGRQEGRNDYPILYIDRSPEIFRDIVRHLQGYYVVPKDEYHFVYLYADAHYYQLPKLVKLLFNSEIFVRIGSTPFRIPKELLSKPGDSPNFFSLGFSSFFASPEEVFPGTRGLIRPPAVAPPQVLAHSEELFQQLLQAFKGAPLQFKSPEHRDLLIKECKYYHFRGLEQKLIPIDISKNLLTGREEITIRLRDIKPASVNVDSNIDGDLQRVRYKRPYTDDELRDLVIQVDQKEIVLRAYDIANINNDSSGKRKCRWGVEIIQGSTTAKQLEAIVAKFPPTVNRPETNGPCRLASDLHDAYIVIDGVETDAQYLDDGSIECFYPHGSYSSTSRKRKRTSEDEEEVVFTHDIMPLRNLAVSKAQFKLYIIKGMVIMQILSIDCISSLREANQRRGFL